MRGGRKRLPNACRGRIIVISEKTIKLISQSGGDRQQRQWKRAEDHQPDKSDQGNGRQNTPYKWRLAIIDNFLIRRADLNRRVGGLP